MKSKLKTLALGVGTVASIVTPISATLSCGNKEVKKNTVQAANGTNTQIQTPAEKGSYDVGSKIWEVWEDNQAVTAQTPEEAMKEGDDSALDYIINDKTLTDANLTAVTGDKATKITAGLKKVISYYTGDDFANNRIEVQVVEKVNNVFKIRETATSEETNYTNEHRKVDVYGYEVKGTGENNKLKLIGSSVTALSHAFYLYVKQHHYGLIDWADAKGGTWDAQHHHVTDFKKQGNSLRIPGTPEGEKFGNGKALAAASRRVARSPYQQHFQFNNVTDAYTTAYWDKSQWEAELNWLAVHGYDLILNPTATEAVQFQVWKNLLFPNASNEEAYAELKKFFTGPSFSSWQRKGNITNYDVFKTYADFKAWNDKQVELAKFIKSEARKRGIDTIALGFSGFVPTAAAGKTMHVGNNTLSFSEADLYTTQWGGKWGEEHISETSSNSKEEGNLHWGHMLDPSITAKDADGNTALAADGKPITGYQVIGNEIVNVYNSLFAKANAGDPNGTEERLQEYFDQDPFDEMHPQPKHADPAKGDYTTTLISGSRKYTGKKAFLADLGFGLSRTALGAKGYTADTMPVTTNIGWQYTYMRADWTRDSVQAMLVGADSAHPNFTPDSHLILSLGEDWNKNGKYGTDGTHPRPGEDGFTVYRDGYDFAYYAGWQDFGNNEDESSLSMTDVDALYTTSDKSRGLVYDYDNVQPGGASYAYVPIVCLGSGNLPDGELPQFGRGLSQVFYNINKFPGGHANKDGKRPILDNLRAYGPGMEGFEQNAISYEMISDMGWRQEPLNVTPPTGYELSKPTASNYDDEETTMDIFNAWLTNYAWNRYGFNDQDMVDFLKGATTVIQTENGRASGIYAFSSGNPRHAFEYSYAGGNNPYKASRVTDPKFAYQNYLIFQKVARRHQKDNNRNQLFLDDLSLYTLDYLGIRFDQTLTQLKEFIDVNASQIAIEGTPERAKFEEYRELSKWYYHVMDKLMAATTLWRMERWTDFAKEWGDTPEQKAFFAADSKRILTVWGPDTISDYAARAWQGLIRYQGMARDHAFELIENGKDPISWQDHAQYFWSEENFVTPTMSQDFWEKPFNDPFGKAVQLFSIASTLNEEGVIQSQVLGVKGQSKKVSVAGTAEQFTTATTATVNGGISTVVKMEELDSMFGNEIKLDLKSTQGVHITNIYYNGVSNKNELLAHVDADLTAGNPIQIQVPQRTSDEFIGGNNGDLQIYIEGTTLNGATLENVAIDVTTIPLYHMGMKPSRSLMSTQLYDAVKQTGTNAFTIDQSVANPVAENTESCMAISSYTADDAFDYNIVDRLIHSINSIDPNEPVREHNAPVSYFIKEEDGTWTQLSETTIVDSVVTGASNYHLYSLAQGVSTAFDKLVKYPIGHDGTVEQIKDLFTETHNAYSDWMSRQYSEGMDWETFQVNPEWLKANPAPEQGETPNENYNPHCVDSEEGVYTIKAVKEGYADLTFTITVTNGVATTTTTSTTAN